MSVHAINCDLPPDCSCLRGVTTPSSVSVMTSTEDYETQFRAALARFRTAPTKQEKFAADREAYQISRRAGWTAQQYLDKSREVLNELRGPGLTEEPRKRGSYVVDANGRMWKRGTSLWTHMQRTQGRDHKPVELFEGRYVWSVLLDEYGPVWEVSE